MDKRNKPKLVKVEYVVGTNCWGMPIYCCHYVEI